MSAYPTQVMVAPTGRTRTSVGGRRPAARVADEPPRAAPVLVIGRALGPPPAEG
ncbi:hypothetical protein [Streptomyces incarnatus]|uniref:hypothetical protein n=1 Tax=Streptomyces incarnatus TaxID=665007 RepID=UPI001AD7EF3F|nr:hypothetical protein [Streptomyces incarnatus]